MEYSEKETNLYILSRYGGIGRHKRLKISRGQLRAGSSPATCIIMKELALSFVWAGFLFLKFSVLLFIARLVETMFKNC